MAKEDLDFMKLLEQKTKEIEEKFQEKMAELENRAQLLEIIARKQVPGSPVESQLQPMKSVIEIIADGKTYFCETAQEKQIFFKNHPNLKKFVCNTCSEKFDTPAKIRRCPKCGSENIYATFECFKVDLPVFAADEYLNDPENKKQFVRKVKNE